MSSDIHWARAFPGGRGLRRRCAAACSHGLLLVYTPSTCGRHSSKLFLQGSNHVHVPEHPFLLRSVDGDLPHLHEGSPRWDQLMSIATKSMRPEHPSLHHGPAGLDGGAWRPQVSILKHRVDGRFTEALPI